MIRLGQRRAGGGLHRLSARRRAVILLISIDCIDLILELVLFVATWSIDPAHRLSIQEEHQLVALNVGVLELLNALMTRSVFVVSGELPFTFSFLDDSLLPTLR